jgi:hypothetical protein
MRSSVVIDDDRRAEASLRAWAGPIVGPDEVIFAGADRRSEAARGVRFHLEAIEPGHRPAARYTVTTWDQEPEAASAMLARMVMASIDHPALDVDFSLPPRASWPALDPEPRPVCRVRVEMPAGKVRSVRSVRSAGRRWR